MLFGAQVSLLVGFSSMVVAMVIGVTLGCLAGFYGGWVDNVLMRIVDALLAIPYLVFLFVLSIVFSNGTVITVVLIIATLAWPATTRIVRAQFLSLKHQEFLMATRTLGASDIRLMLRHILPNAAGPIIVNATLLVGINIITESILSFFGFGLAPPQSSWGVLLGTVAGFLQRRPANALPAWLRYPHHSALFQSDWRWPTRRARSTHDPALSDSGGMARTINYHGACCCERRCSLAPILEVKGLKTQFRTRDGTIKAVNGVSFDLDEGETIGIVGESGSGKSVTSLSILRLLPTPPAEIVEGEITFEGRDLLEMDERELRKIRGGQISMIFQDPISSLNPVMRISQQLLEPINLHLGIKGAGGQ